MNDLNISAKIPGPGKGVPNKVFILGYTYGLRGSRGCRLYAEIYSLNFSEYLNNLSYTYVFTLYARFLSVHYD